MSIDYWPILGYGIDLNSIELDQKKVVEVLEIDTDIEDYSLGKFAEYLTEQSDILDWSAQEAYGDAVFLYLPASLPWVKFTRNVVPATVEFEITRLLRPFLSLRQTEEDIKAKIFDISSIGYG